MEFLTEVAHPEYRSCTAYDVTRELLDDETDNRLAGMRGQGGHGSSHARYVSS